MQRSGGSGSYCRCRAATTPDPRCPTAPSSPPAPVRGRSLHLVSLRHCRGESLEGGDIEEQEGRCHVAKAIKSIGYRSVGPGHCVRKSGQMLLAAQMTAARCLACIPIPIQIFSQQCSIKKGANTKKGKVAVEKDQVHKKLNLQVLGAVGSSELGVEGRARPTPHVIGCVQLTFSCFPWYSTLPHNLRQCLKYREVV